EARLLGSRRRDLHPADRSGRVIDDFNPAPLRGVFLQEAEEALSAMEQALIALERAPESEEPLNEIFRLAHTIKGGAAMVDFPALAEYAHRFEDALSVMRDGGVAVDAARVTGMLQVVDALREILATQARGTMTRLRATDIALISRLIPVELQLEEISAEAAELRGFHMPEHAVVSAATTNTRSLRVDMAKLDGMLTLSGEIAVAKGRMMQVLAHEGAGVTEAGLSAAEEMGRLLTTLHERVMEMRLVPIGPLFRQHLRTVRDVAASQGKLIRLALEGEDV